MSSFSYKQIRWYFVFAFKKNFALQYFLITEKNKDVLHEKTLFRIDIMLGLELNLLEAINELMFKQKVFHLHK